MLYSIAAVLVLVLDQAVKYFTVRNIPPQAIGDACKTLIPGVIHMTNVQNYGAAFSILENARWVLVAVSALFILGIIILISMDIIHTKFGRWTAVLVMAGALGNCIDRVLLGYVVDMFEFELFNFAVFNVADIFITVCGILFCLHVIIYREPEAERNAVPRPAKQKKGRRAPAPEQIEDYDDGEEEEAPRRPAKAPKAKAARQKKPDPHASIPHRDRSGRRALPEQDEAPLPDPDDPFAEWDAPAEPAPAARPAKRRTAPTVEDNWDQIPAPVQPAAPKRPAQPVQPAKPAQARKQPDDAGFDEYSLEDILSEFRDL